MSGFPPLFLASRWANQIAVEAPLTTRSLPLHCVDGEAEEEVDTSNAEGFAWEEVK